MRSASFSTITLPSSLIDIHRLGHRHTTDVLEESLHDPEGTLRIHVIITVKMKSAEVAGMCVIETHDQRWILPLLFRLLPRAHVEPATAVMLTVYLYCGRSRSCCAYTTLNLQDMSSHVTDIPTDLGFLEARTIFE